MRHFVLAACLAATTALTPALAEEIPGSQFEAGNWTGAAHTDERGEFSYCAVSVGYTNNETLWIGLYPNDTLSILLSHPDVLFRPGEQFDMTIMMETGLPWTGVGEAWDEYFAGITWEGIQPTVDFLVSGQYLRMLGIGIDEGYDVQGIPEALALAQTCLAQNTRGGKNLGVAPVKTPPPPKVPDLSKPRTSGTGTGSVLGTPAPKPAP
jgi:hypothetical protein